MPFINYVAMHGYVLMKMENYLSRTNEKIIYLGLMKSPYQLAKSYVSQAGPTHEILYFVC